jgi:brefeldin A-resistance guanine nucleotide exchange factor 1
MDAFLDKMDFGDSCIEKSMRKFLSTFRLAGVDSQVVGRIIEKFGHKFHEMDEKSTFVSKAESYDFAYLIIVLQTSQHNPSVKTKVDLKSFIQQAKINCPKSAEALPESFFEEIFNKVTNTSFYTPMSRSLLEENYNVYNMIEVEIRLSKS